MAPLAQGWAVRRGDCCVLHVWDEERSSPVWYHLWVVESWNLEFLQGFSGQRWSKATENTGFFPLLHFAFYLLSRGREWVWERRWFLKGSQKPLSGGCLSINGHWPCVLRLLLLQCRHGRWGRCLPSKVNLKDWGGPGPSWDTSRMSPKPCSDRWVLNPITPRHAALLCLLASLAEAGPVGLM